MRDATCMPAAFAIESKGADTSERPAMTEFAIPAPAAPSIPTTDGTAFPVRRVYCIGRNFAAHAVEMGHDPDRDPPFFFQKNPDIL
jgi:fumarylpyruvate hydrolase